MSLTRHIAAEARLRVELNEALRERDAARSERDAARLVVGDQASTLRAAGVQISYLTGERDELDAAHRAALVDLAEAYRQLAEANLALWQAREPERPEPFPAPVLRGEPDMDRCG
ncbi:hypothetical protein I5H06_gp54 [Mycobacterium phage SirPhilip]|uniref:Uncharacterized protein n=1 Tax=Mycobacterium phage SirPhilip TaxID=2015824 RepID=A0A222ZMK2_9CAUD|nr:hypothetical protein I5H06_gp54 [Mycobacterium phage SirPhilip]ASR85250.1 hypothetical protein SEA_SIRPHILIP_48 [Mycobacterium phage SirPhilip]